MTMEVLNQTLPTVVQVAIPLIVGMFMFRFGWKLFRAFILDDYVHDSAVALHTDYAELAFSKAHRIGAATAKNHTLRLGRFQ